LTRNPQRLLILGAIAIGIAGLATDIAIGHDAFARAGSLITAYGIAVAGREIYRTERATARHEGRIEKLEAGYLDAVGAHSTEIDPEAFSRIAKNFADYRNDHVEKVGKLLHTEIGIVCSGTLIWGFGDLVV
jgi:hypothetical protein